MNYILQNPKFTSLFKSSLEMQKFSFIKRLGDLIEDEFDTAYTSKIDKL